MSSNTMIDVSEIERLVNNKTFDEIKVSMEENGIRVRELSYVEDLYLLVSENDDNCTDIQVQCNGIILEKKSNKIVCMSQNKISKNIDENEFKELQNNYELNAEYCEDGTVIRLYNYKDKWFTATTKCIDARHSYWSSEKTFDEMFWDLFDENLLDKLQPDCTYSFILRHKDNRIVVNHNESDLVFINRINNLTKEEDRTKLFDFQSVLKIELDQQKLLEEYYVTNKRGVIVRCFDKNKVVTYQYDFKKYEEIKNVRGNVPLLRMRYLELLNDPESLKLLETYYPENFFLFAMVKHCMENLYKEIHQLYYNSHIKHSIRVDQDHPMYRTLTQLHGVHKKQNVVISLDEVKKKVNTLDKNVLKKLLRWV